MRFFFDIVYLIQQDIAQEHIKTFINLLFVRRGEDDGFIATGEETRFRLSSCFSVCSLFCRFVSYLSLYIYNLYLQLFSASSCAYYVLSLLESKNYLCCTCAFLNTQWLIFRHIQYMLALFGVVNLEYEEQTNLSIFALQADHPF